MLGIFERKYFKNTSGIIGTTLLLISAVLALYTAYGYFFEYGKVDGVYQKLIVIKYEWLRFSPSLLGFPVEGTIEVHGEGPLSIDMGIMLDPISVMMLVVVTFISLMVHIYSLSYMKGDQRFPV